MSTIGAISATLPSTTALPAQIQPKRDTDGDEATESNSSKAAEAASPRKVDTMA